MRALKTIEKTPMRKSVLCLTLACALVARAEQLPGDEEFATMRDGVRLAANVYRPQGAGPWPVILTRTPYLKDGEEYGRGDWARYTDAGYVFVVQDVRGRGHSEGVYRAFQDDLLDGYDSVEWAAHRPWSIGAIGVTGGSAMGIAANMAAAANPPSLKAAYVEVAPHSRFDEATFQGGVFKEADVGGWMTEQGQGDRVDGVKARVVWDEGWAQADFLPHIAGVRVPIYNVGGWYDIFSIGNVRNYIDLQHEGAPGARGNQKLRMGPFGHGDLAGDLVYPQGSGVGGDTFPADEIRWFDYWLKGAKNGVMDEPRVRYYMMAAARKGRASPVNGWRESADWPPPNTPTPLYLTQTKALSRDVPGRTAKPLSYRFDPAQPVPTVGGANLMLPLGPMDQRAIPAREDYLRFETERLERALAIAGPVTLTLWAATDGPDTDFMAKLVDVYPDGYEAIVLDAPLRARYRFGRRPEDVRMMTPGRAEKLTIDLWQTAITFEAGHKIALHVTSSNSPRFEVNPNNGSAPGGDPGVARVATNSIYVDREHASALLLPVLTGE